MNSRQSTRRMGRRQALHLFGAGVAVSGLASLGACGGNKEPAAPAKAPEPAPTAAPSAAAPPPTAAPTGPQTCETAVDAASTQLRASVQYKDVANPPEKNCAACAQFLAGKYGECGGCNLFTGPVKPGGGCLAFAPRDPNAAPAPTTAPKPT